MIDEHIILDHEGEYHKYEMLARVLVWVVVGQASERLLLFEALYGDCFKYGETFRPFSKPLRPL